MNSNFVDFIVLSSSNNAREDYTVANFLTISISSTYLTLPSLKSVLLVNQVVQKRVKARTETLKRHNFIAKAIK